MVQADTESIKGSRDAQSCAFDLRVPTSRFPGLVCSNIGVHQNWAHNGDESRWSCRVDGAVGLALNVAGCGSSAKLMSGLSIEGIQARAGYPGKRKARERHDSWHHGRSSGGGDRRTAPRYLSLEAGGDEGRGLQVGQAVEIMVNDHDEDCGLSAPGRDAADQGVF